MYDQGFEQERERIAGMEALWDHGSQRLLHDVGIDGGTRVLEVGGGGGSMVRWMAAQGADVLVTDIDTRFLEPLAGDRIEVRRHDIRSDALPSGEFDLIHSRLVLEHLPERVEVIARLRDALKPGGWMVIEDYDWTGFGFEPSDELGAKTAEAVLGFMQTAGFEPYFGRTITSDFVAAGLQDVRGEGRVLSIAPDSPGYPFFRLSFESLRGAVVASGRLTDEEADAMSDRLASPDGRVLTPLLMAAIGRR